MKKALVLGGGGFIGDHLVSRLKNEDFWVRAVDLNHPITNRSEADEFIIGDLRNREVCVGVLDLAFDEVYQLAADMGGAGFIFTGENDADIMHNSALININVLEVCRDQPIKKIFYSSSACVYPEYNQLEPHNPLTTEISAYPADPDSEYGWEKLFSERLYLSYQRNYGIEVHIARYHNIFGPQGSWCDGREKAPAAMCRKIAEADDGGEIEVWGDGKQTRSFLYITECLEGSIRLMRSSHTGPYNIGSDEMVTIDQLTNMIIVIAKKELKIKHIDGPQGVRGRTSDNRLISEELGWKPSQNLEAGLRQTYPWIEKQVRNRLES
jgi:GDP-D-mannose 3', 5'-epimerase